MGVKTPIDPADPLPLRNELAAFTRESSSLSSVSSVPGEDTLLNEQITVVMQRGKLLVSKLTEQSLLTPHDEEKKVGKRRTFQDLETGEVENSLLGVEEDENCEVTPCQRHQNAYKRRLSVIKGGSTSSPCQYTEKLLLQSNSTPRAAEGLVIDTRSELVETLNLFIDLLCKSQEQVRQLKLKNLILSSNLKDIVSRTEVEMNLSKHLFDKVKCHLNIEKQELKDQVRNKDMKVMKYRETIIEKNKQINKLMRILNGTSSSKDNASLASSVQGPRLVRTHDAGHDSKLARSDSNMLTTLGILASRVLGEEMDYTHVQDSESDCSHSQDGQSSVLSAANSRSLRVPPKRQLQMSSQRQPIPSAIKAQHFHSMPVLSETRSDTTTSTSSEAAMAAVPVTNSELRNTPHLNTTLPKMPSFNTFDGSMKEA
ncbi:Fdo1p Ecym_6050 [Eremothecium cymbalariae DBVPG|uniref:Uncharacterized protein n=1 Tax=Eremothecium cymbalariae (strain CBS 270.75 / DBVPG 7215 / KCTC 17166 / NRRL Y-17582) TaxID=931890 RepID=G8JUX4_ERECY|nr:hypothetical protein Ecym_6050 [Eremothecium cymbalariae DBVPG\